MYRTLNTIQAAGKAAIALALCLVILGALAPQRAMAQASILNYEHEFGKVDGFFHKPQGVAVDQQGNVYVTDYDDNRVQVFDDAGNFVRKWGWFGEDPGEFVQPLGIEINDALGRIYVAEMGNERIQVFDLNGKYLFHFGSQGQGDGQFSDVHDMAFGSKGLYVADTWNHRIQIFDHDGNYYGQWGGQGSGLGQFETPKAIAVHDDLVYVADTGNDRVQVFDALGGYLSSFGITGTGKGEFVAPSGIDVDVAGIVVADTGNHRVQRFDLAGGYRDIVGSSGSAPGQMNAPTGIVAGIDPNLGDFFVADADNHRVQRIDARHNVLQILGSATAPDGHLTDPMGIVYHERVGLLYVADYGNNRVQAFDVEGKFALGINLSFAPIDVAVDLSESNLWTLTSDGTVHRHTYDGALLSAWTPPQGGNPGEIGAPKGLAVDPDQTVYIANQYSFGAGNTNGRIHVADAAGNHLATWGATGLSPANPPPLDTFELPADLEIDLHRGGLYVAVEGQTRVKQIVSDGNFGIRGGLEHFTGSTRRPFAVATGPEDALFVADGVGRLTLYKPFNHVEHQQDRITGGGPGEFRAIGDMEYVEENSEHPSLLIFSGRENNRIQVFTIDGF